MHSSSSPDVRDPHPGAPCGGAPGSAIHCRVPEFLTIAVVLAPWGLRGELKVRLETDFPDRFARLTTVYLGGEREPFEFEGFRRHKEYGLLKLKGCENREAAQKLRGMDVRIPIGEAMPLRPRQYYEHQIEGLDVVTEEGQALGTIQEVLFTGSKPVYVIQGPRGEVLIPALKDVVREIDVEAGQMVVRLPPGLVG